MVAAGAPVPRDNHCEAIAKMALDMRDWIDNREAHDGIRLQLRIGINSGTAIGAVVGTSKFSYDLWGDAVNVASRMEANGEPGQIHIAEGTRKRLGDAYVFESRGMIDVKGKGEMETWFLEGLHEA